MARILNLFSSSSLLLGSRSNDDLDANRSASVTEGFVDSEAANAASFQGLAESRESTDASFASVIHGMESVQTLLDQVHGLRHGVAELYEEQRKLSQARLTLERERGNVQAKYQDKSSQAARLQEKLTALNSELEKTQISLEKSRAETEALAQRQHVLILAKKEVDEVCSRTTSQLLSTQEEADGLRIEVEALREQVSDHAEHIADLASKLNEAVAEAALSGNRCEAYQVSMSAQVDEIASLKEQVDVLTREHDSAVQFGRHKEREVIDIRSELAKAFEKSQADYKAKEKELNHVRLDLDNAQAGVKMLEQVNYDLKIDNEKTHAEVRHLQEAKKQLEVSTSRLDAKVNRLTSNLEAVTGAKTEIAQSRGAMAARVETVSQSLGEREGDVKRLEGHVTRLTAQLEDQTSSSRDIIEHLTERVFELEKDLASQRNEAAFYSTQLEAIRRPEARETAE